MLRRSSQDLLVSFLSTLNGSAWRALLAQQGCPKRAPIVTMHRKLLENGKGLSIFRAPRQINPMACESQLV